MSSPPFSDTHYEDCSFPSLPDADLWSLLQEIDVSAPVDDQNPLDPTNPKIIEQENSAKVLFSRKEKVFGDNPVNAVLFDEENSSTLQSRTEKKWAGDNTNLSTTSERNRRIKHSQAKKALLQHSSNQPGSSVINKQKHNAKERVRRMQVNASYLALLSLLPDGRRSKVMIIFTAFHPFSSQFSQSMHAQSSLASF